MPRLPRINVDGSVYYVTSRAIQNEVIFKDKEDYKMYLDLVNKYKSQHKFRLYSYCLLPERLELLIETGDDASISEIMHDLNSLYTKYFNGRYDKRGHLFESRFRSVLVEKAYHLLEMTRQIHRGPPDAKEYPYSSFQIYVHGQNSQPDLTSEIAEVLQFLKAKGQSASYEKYVLEGDSKEIHALQKRLRRGSILGSTEFEQLVKNKAQQHVEELKEAAKPAKLKPVTLFFIGGFIVVAAASSVYLYISKQKIQNDYTQLLNIKESEFAEKTRFENISPLALTELDGTAWRVDLVELPADQAKTVTHDTVHFSEGRFWSERWIERGFKPSSYTVMVRPGSVTTWELSQTNAAGDALSWRGDWQADVMKGMIRYTPAGKNPQIFSFYSVGWSYVEPASMGSEGGVS